MYDGVNMSRTSGFAVGLLAATTFLPAAAAETLRARTAEPAAPLVRADTIRLAGHRYVADLADGGRAELTLDPRLQQSTENLLRAFQIPFGGAVVVSIPDGRVLALVGQSAADRRLGPSELALRAWAPAASVFKVISATALVENGIMGSTRTCYHGGVSSILRRQPRRSAGDRSPLRHAGVRPGQVPERDHRQARDAPPDRGRPRPRRPQLRFRRGDPVRAAHRAVAPGRPGRRPPGVRPHRGRLLAFHAVADARRAARRRHRQPRADARPDAD